MKTDQLMRVALAEGSINVFHKSMTTSLTDVFVVGNRYRILDGQAAYGMTHFCNSKATQEFLQLVADDTGISKNELLYTTGKGKTARVMAHLYIMIYAAEKLSPRFHLEVIKAFVEGMILALRDVSGDLYKDLNEKIK